jgi:NAD(P)-dependent dehydrogenase (short-subunit alcohol dehydrogenase family)
MSSSERAVVISGASKGIGRASAVELANRGFRVFAGVRTTEDADALAADRGSITPVPLDVTRPEQVAAAAETIREAVGDRGLWGLVNNAGIVVVGPLEFLPLDAFRTQFDVNLFGVLALTQALLPLLRVARGRVVNVSSVNGRLAVPFSGAYAASKFALEAMSDALRIELSRSGVRVVVIQPGAIRTPIWETSPERGQHLAGRYPPEATAYYGGVLKRLPDVRVPAHALPPERVAAVVARALIARRPRTRYHVGWDARVGILLARLLPGRVLDRLLGARG